jgi:hypothetical protein
LLRHRVPNIQFKVVFDLVDYKTWFLVGTRYAVSLQVVRECCQLISCTWRLKPQLYKRNLPQFTLERSEGQVKKCLIFGQSAQADLVCIVPQNSILRAWCKIWGQGVLVGLGSVKGNRQLSASSLAVWT